MPANNFQVDFNTFIDQTQRNQDRQASKRQRKKIVPDAMVSKESEDFDILSSERPLVSNYQSHKKAAPIESEDFDILSSERHLMANYSRKQAPAVEVSMTDIQPRIQQLKSPEDSFKRKEKEESEVPNLEDGGEENDKRESALQ